MLGALAKKLFGSSNDRRVKGYQPRVAAINALETEIAALSDEALKARTEQFKREIAEGKKLDDLSIAGPSTIVRVGACGSGMLRVEPSDAGLPRHPLDALRGDDPAYNAAALRRLLQGERGAYRDAVLLNSAASLMVAGHADSLTEGVEEAGEALDNGLANTLLDCWIAYR